MIVCNVWNIVHTSVTGNGPSSHLQNHTGPSSHLSNIESHDLDSTLECMSAHITHLLAHEYVD